MPLDFDRLAVFPLWPAIDGVCACRLGAQCETKPGTHPYFRWKDLGTGEKLEGPVGSNYGIATGARSGVFVVDLDGEAAMSWWEAQGGTYETYCVETSRGFHLYYAWPGFVVRNSAPGQNPIFEGVDVRGDGGMVLAEGSVHRSGHVYTVVDENAPVLPAPAFLLEWPGLKKTRADLDDAGALAPIPVTGALLVERTRAGATACATMRAAVQGEGGSAALWAVAIELVRTLELPLEAALELLETIYNPRCEPPWDTELLLHKLHDARDSSDRPCGPELDDAAWDSLCSRMKATSKGLKPGASPPEDLETPNRWKHSFTPGRDIANDKPDPSNECLAVNMANMLATHEHWNGALRWDSFRNRIVAKDPPLVLDAERGQGLSDDDIAGIRMWLAAVPGKTLSREDAMDVIKMAAKRVQFHPIQKYLESCRGKGGDGSILDDLALHLFKSTEPLAQEFLKKTLVGAVRRVYHPGTKMDTMLVLTGPQGGFKSTFVRVLFGQEYTRSQMPDLESKDSSLALQGFWGIELAELDKVLRAGNETVLEFLSRVVDDYRAPYARCESHTPRSCVFIGTTNASDFLRDANGSRRYWPIEVLRVDLAFLRAHRDEIWGAALDLAEDPSFKHWFEDESEVAPAHAPFVAQDAWHEDVVAYLEGKIQVRPRDVFVNGLNCKIGDFDKSKQMRVADTLKRLGCTPKQDGKGRRVFEVPEALAGIKNSPTGADKLRGRFGGM